MEDVITYLAGGRIEKSGELPWGCACGGMPEVRRSTARACLARGAGWGVGVAGTGAFLALRLLMMDLNVSTRSFVQ